MDNQQPSLELLWGSLTGYQRTAALKAAIELDVFSQITAGAVTLEQLAERCQAKERGLRALLNHMVVDGFLTKKDESYGLTATSAAFLDRGSPAYLGSVASFIASPMLRDTFALLTDAVRRGGTAVPDDGTLAPEHPVWVEFARSMAPLAAMMAQLVGSLLEVEKLPAGKLLDVSAGHGMFGITLAQRNPGLQIYALDWANVLQVAAENARGAGVHDRFHPLAGSAFEVAFGEGYQLVLLPNFLHHFDPQGCETILSKARAALAPGGKLAIVEFVPNDDRVSPPEAATFALVMLASTPGGDAYTFAEYRQMLHNAGFPDATLHDMPPAPGRAIIATR